MKFTSVLAAGLLASVSQAFSVSLWASNGYNGQEKTYTTTGSHSLGFTAKSYKWSSPLGDGCCIVFCKGSTQVGNYCDSHSNSGKCRMRIRRCSRRRQMRNQKPWNR
jgi:hypothetical protein